MRSLDLRAGETRERHPGLALAWVTTWAALLQPSLASAVGLIAEERTVSRLAPVLHNSAEAPGVVGHDAVDAGPDQGTEVAAVINRPDNEAHARPGWARGVDRIAPLEFRQEKISPRLEGHD